MKKILLIGDSTMFGSDASSGYGVYVSEHFRKNSTAEVIMPSDNCQDTRFTKNAFCDIFAEHADSLADVDIIHWNNGLWDTLHFLGNKRPVVPIDRYRTNLADIHAMLLKLCPRARIIFATTTPADESKNDRNYRKNEEIAEYNKAAVDLLSPLGCEINDFTPTQIHTSGTGVRMTPCTLPRMVASHFRPRLSPLLARFYDTKVNDKRRCAPFFDTGYTFLYYKALFAQHFIYHSVKQAARTIYHKFGCFLHTAGHPTHKYSHKDIRTGVGGKQLVILVNFLAVGFVANYRKNHARRNFVQIVFKMLSLYCLENFLDIDFPFKCKTKYAKISRFPVFVVYAILTCLPHLHLKTPNHQFVDVIKMIIKGHTV